MSSADGFARGILVRPAATADAAALHALVQESEGTLERFDDTPAAAAAAIAASEASLAGRAAPAAYDVLLVAADATGGLLGCIGLRGRVGLEQPFYDYRLGRIVHSSRPLDSYRCLDVLYLCNDLTGAAELHSLYVRRDARRRGVAGRLVGEALAFVARHREDFGEHIVVELRGAVDAGGRSPFWEAVGRHFFRVEQRQAERLVARGRKAFIAELMPKHPVYVSLLPDAAQHAVGSVHHDVAALADRLAAAGFRFAGHVDIFDGGRVLEARVADLVPT